MTAAWACLSSSDFSSPEQVEAIALTIGVGFTSASWRATVSGTALLWEINTGGNFVPINTYDLTDPAYDTLGELRLAMIADAPQLPSITLGPSFVAGDPSVLLVDGTATATPGNNGVLFAVVP